MKMHASLTPERIIEAVEMQRMTLEDPGFCVACGEDDMGVEPDARKCKCEACGEYAVYGAEELLFHLAG
jgi:hypothetical protein